MYPTHPFWATPLLVFSFEIMVCLMEIGIVWGLEKDNMPEEEKKKLLVIAIFIANIASFVLGGFIQFMITHGW